MPKVATQWNSGATWESNRGRRVLILNALTTRPPSPTVVVEVVVVVVVVVAVLTATCRLSWSYIKTVCVYMTMSGLQICAQPS